MIRIKTLITEKFFPITSFIFYGVGLGLFIMPFSRQLFVVLIPWVILASLIITLAKHQNWNFKSLVAFLLIYTIAQFTETFGVADSRIFGSYVYLSALGLKLMEAPLIIGINWLFLVYSSHALSSLVTNKPIIRILLASLLMVIYDICIEFVAPELKMWEFKTSYPPIQNFTSWFLLAFVLQSILEIFRIKTQNTYASVLFVSQIIFFTLISTYYLIFIRG